MSNFQDVFSNIKPCFGKFENWDISYHCKACIIRDDCEIKSKEHEDGQG